MIRTLRNSSQAGRLRTALAALLVLLAAAYLGRRPSMLWLGMLAAGIGGAALLALPVLGLPALVLASLVVPLEIGTGTDVKLNLAALLIPALAVVWLLDMARRRDVRIAPSRANLPLLLFLAASLLSLLIGRVTWDPTVPVGGNFLLVQLAQWAIFAFSALAFWLAGNLIKDTRWLWRLTALFLLVGGGLAILSGTARPGRAGGPLHHHRLHPRALLGAVDRGGRRATLVQPRPLPPLAGLPAAGAGRQPVLRLRRSSRRPPPTGWGWQPCWAR